MGIFSIGNISYQEGYIHQKESDILAAVTSCILFEAVCIIHKLAPTKAKEKPEKIEYKTENPLFGMILPIHENDRETKTTKK